MPEQAMPEQVMNVLVLNAGSSSLKFQILSSSPELIRQNRDQRLCRGQIERIGGEALFTTQVHDHPKQTWTAPVHDLAAALDALLRWLASPESGIPEISALSDIHAAGHRVVHGGELFTQSEVITETVLNGIRDCVDLAPLHNPDNIKGIEAVRHVLGDKLPQVAVFDTAFHQSLPESAYLYALPYHLYRRHRIRRYGFHGTSYRYVAYRYRMLRHLTREQTHIVAFHLGNGCSAAAIRGGYPVDTSMGMTPLEGLVMGTRSGDLDPAIVDVLASKEGLSSREADMLLNKQSGLLGVSGLTNDMRELEEEIDKTGDRRARLAVEIFCYRARKYLGAYLAAMEGVAEAVVFTGGIGENSPRIRAGICAGMSWAGLTLDEEKNTHAIAIEQKISTEDSKLAAYVIPTDEELLIARDTVRTILGLPHPS
jgi:acetate kinase